jgi:branched-chain amino acid transport system permease protein
MLGIPFDTTASSTWVAAAVLIIGGGLLARLSWARIAAAWDRAAIESRKRGYVA